MKPKPPHPALSPEPRALEGERSSIPRATYRLQFNRDFTFADAAKLAPYLAELGISHLYASPWLKARAGSTHGYDIIDHSAFNPELGGKTRFGRLQRALRAHGLGHILDFVPNHMGIAQADNAWWLDILEWGRASPFADYFDIAWTSPDPQLRNKVLLPFLGDHYGRVLEAGELQPRFDRATGTFSVWYHEHRFPLAPRTYAVPMHAAHAPELESMADAFARLRIRASASPRRTAEVRARAAELNAQLAHATALHPALERGAAALCGEVGKPQSFLPLHRVLERQGYRLAFWRVAADEINYRRFFDINGLAGIRIENRDLFDHVHRLVARLLAEGALDGLRIDHIDGLFDPAQYLRRVRRLTTRPFYLVVEKILARHERLRGWPVEGTTGYDFMNEVNGLLVQRAGKVALTRTYRRVIGHEADFDAIVHAARRQIARGQLSSELHVLAREIDRIAERNPRTRDYTLQGFTHALEEVVAAFPVYRTYVDPRGADADDRRDITWAIARARRRWQQPGADIFDFIESVLTCDLVAAAGSGYPRKQVRRFAMRFQQYTAPVMAKTFEDTAFYRYHRLIGLNEVGGDPRRFGLSVTAFHHANAARAECWPHAMLATATHDSKRGEDARARLAVLSTMPREWREAVQRWAHLNQRWKKKIDGAPAPDRNDEYLLYQTLIGAWPVELMDGHWDAAVAARFIDRIQACMTKALREAKVHSAWTRPDEPYEQATADFVARVLDRNGARPFLDAFLPLQGRVAERGVDNALVQLALKLTCPGVPDIYQGTELWDLSLVDPDNRRPVDFARRKTLLQDAKAWQSLAPAARRRRVEAWRRHWHDSAIKLHVLYRLLQLRIAQPALFRDGAYRPLDVEAEATGREGVVAFARVRASARIIVVATPGKIGATPAACTGQLRASGHFEDVLTGRAYAADGVLDTDKLLAQLPVAVLLETRCADDTRPAR